MDRELGPRDHLSTEQPNERCRDLDTLTTVEAFDRLNAEDATIAAAVAAARDSIARAADLIAGRLAAGGRLFYVGAGTSGRLATLDAAECPPTFSSDPDQIQAIIAGGPQALTHPIEGAEDDTEAAAAELDRRALTHDDIVFGITAGGTTPFVHGALAHARTKGAFTIFFACVPAEEAPDESDLSIRVLTGPEAVSGSTRMKAGTATKLVLNTISTLAMVRLGKVHGNLMIDVDASANAKLVERARTLVQRVTDCDRDRATELLDAAGGSAKTACCMALTNLDADSARARLESSGGSLRGTL
jgi:N-acetylmuramic acid 6-phosphate etherase